MTGTRLDDDVAAVQRISAVPTILDVVCRTTGMGFAAVARVTEDRWIACQVRDRIAFGLEPGGELAVETTICQEVRHAREAVVINNVAEHPIYCGHPTPAMYGFQSYISMPIFRADGAFFGTLCAFDPRPARLTSPEIVGMFRLFAQLVGFHLDALDRADAAEARLLDARRAAELREEFMAVLGHDLRNPLASIEAGMQVLLRAELDPRSAEVAQAVRRSVARMARLIADVLDLARARLGDGLPAAMQPAVAIAPCLEDVVAELRAGHPDRTIEARFDRGLRLTCDPGAIARLFSNLLGNALTHGAADRPVAAGAGEAGGVFELFVSNGGDPIPPEDMARLFEPFQRGRGRSKREGLGLGLYIASEIARAHGGTIGVDSTERETRFTLRMPMA